MFRVNATMDQRMPLSQVAAHARRAEGLGYDGLDVPEAAHNGLVMATTALGATTRLRVTTSVLVAFPRSPMTVAHAAWDLQEFSRGRFELGLGAQVRGNIVGRYSTPWTAPVPRMREYVQSLRAIFDCWQNGTPLRFEGEHYRFTRMQSFFSPGSMEHGRVPIFLGGVAPRMIALAGEVADGLVTHPTNTAPRYLSDVVRPRLETGARRAGRDMSTFELRVTPLVATGLTGEDVKRERDKIRQLLAFLYSTPAYWPSLDLFGWRERGEHLNRLTREGRWEEMTDAISEEMVDTLIPSATYAEIARVLEEWYGGLADQITFPMPDDPSGDGEAAKVVERLRTGCTERSEK